MDTGEATAAVGPLDTAALAAKVEESFEREIVPALERYVALRCLSPAFDADWEAHGALDEAAAMLRSWAERRALAGVSAEVVRLSGRTPVVLVEVPATDPDRAGTTTLIYGHLDKQPPLSTWRAGLDPFVARREGDQLYGRGTVDDGYAAFAALAALEALAATGTRHGRCVLLIEASEESGSPDLNAYLDHLAERIGRPRLVLCLDAGGPSFDRLWVTTSLRGLLGVSLEVEVLEAGVHSGLASGAVPDSFRIARQLLSRVEDERTGEILLPELHAEIPAHRRDEAAVVAAELGGALDARFPTVAGLVLAGTDATDRLLRTTWDPTLTVIGATGLPAPRDAGNLLRPGTALSLSFRLPPTVEAGAAAAAVVAALGTQPPSGARVRATATESGQGWDAPEEAPWLARATREASLAYFGAPPGHLGIGGSIPFMAGLGHRFPGTQFLATGALGPSSNEHGPDESLHLPTAKAVAATVAHVVASVPV